MTSVFEHADWLHLTSNLTLLLAFAPRVARVLGPWRFVARFLLAGMAANALASTLLARPVIGMSGALAATIGARLALFPRESVCGLPLAPLVGAAMVLHLIAAIAFASSNMAWPAHLAGFALGAILPRAGPRCRRQTKKFRQLLGI
jgi:membrane associated rhomboid family serine protease